MKRLFFALLVLALPTGLAAQAMPSPSLDDPRVQTLVYDPSRPARLVAFPDANLTVMLMPGEQIERVTTSDRDAFDIKITDANDSLNILALRPNASATLVVSARGRRYEFDVSTRGGLAAYLVRVVSSAPAPPSPMPAMALGPARPTATTLYRLSGERSLLPTAMSDDGLRTYIQWGEYQSLPAVFGIGPTGKEEVVDGYMRDGKFTIDRVYSEILFRVDKMQGKARRLGRKAG
jgi:type IV secretion system protein VirB9